MSQQRFSKNLMKRKMINGILDSFTWLFLLLWHTCQCTERRDCKNKMEIKLKFSHDNTHWFLHNSNLQLTTCNCVTMDINIEWWSIVQGWSCRNYSVASNSPTIFFVVMGCKGPISLLFHKWVFQHRTSWSITISLHKHQHLVLGEMPQL
jgi:hypothetical protein